MNSPQKKIALAALAVAAVVAVSPYVLTAPLRTEAVSQPLAGARRAAVRLEVGIARLRLSALDAPSLLAEGRVDLAERLSLERDFRRDGEAAALTLAERRKPGLNLRGVTRGAGWDLGLARGVPLYLELRSGVGEAQLDLSELSVRSLDLEAGVGSLEVTLPRSGLSSGRVRGGVGEVTVRVPRGLASRIRASAGIGGVEADEGFARDGDLYVTAGAEAAAELRVAAGIGGVRLETAP